MLAGCGRGRTQAFGSEERRTVRSGRPVGACSVQHEASSRIPPLGRHVFCRGSEPPKTNVLRDVRIFGRLPPGSIGARLRVGDGTARQERPACRTRLERGWFGRGSRRHEGLVPAVGLTACQRAPGLETSCRTARPFRTKGRYPSGYPTAVWHRSQVASFGWWQQSVGRVGRSAFPQGRRRQSVGSEGGTP